MKKYAVKRVRRIDEFSVVSRESFCVNLVEEKRESIKLFADEETPAEICFSGIEEVSIYVCYKYVQVNCL